VCGDVACKTACARDDDCVGGTTCDASSGHCVFGAKCDGDHTVISPSGDAKDCSPIRCAGVACLIACGSTDDCVAGFDCDVSTGRCVAPAPSGASGSCAVSANGDARVALCMLLGLALLGRARVKGGRS
jgi:hypothetical protein